MSGRAQRLDRLLAIRKLNEDLDRRTLQLALAAVGEVEAGLARQEAALSDSKLVASRALSQGDRGEWLMAEAQNEVVGWNRRGLQTLLHTRAAVAADALKKFVKSRREHEQVARLMENSRQTERTEGNRKAQAAADDWFLARPPRDIETEL